MSLWQRFARVSEYSVAHLTMNVRYSACFIFPIKCISLYVCLCVCLLNGWIPKRLCTPLSVCLCVVEGWVVGIAFISLC